MPFETSGLQKQDDTDKHDKSCVYALKCRRCGKRYVGRPGSPFLTRRKRHFSSYTNQNQNFKFAEYLHGISLAVFAATP